MFKRLVRLVLAGAGLALFLSCAETITAPAKFRYFVVEAQEPTQLMVVCDNTIVYRLDLVPGDPVEIGGPDAACQWFTSSPVKLLVKPEFEQAR